MLSELAKATRLVKKLGRYRDRLEIIADLLSVVADGARKTRIMYQANLSYELLTRYLDKVEKAGLARFENPQYKLTEKGREFLDLFKRYSKRRKHLEKRFVNLGNERKMLEEVCFGQG